MASKKDSYWIPLADLMTVLMVIFLFVAISFMVLIKKNQSDQDEILKDYQKTKIALYNELDSTFTNDFHRWNLKLDKDLSIRFTNPKVLFPEGSAELAPEFENVLTEFLPKYIGVVMQGKYQDKIEEIRIEGHTNTKPIGDTTDPYIDNMALSQGRARNVLAFLRKQECFTGLENYKEELLQYWLTANGLSYGRTIDTVDSLTFESKNPIDNDKSRRVEFRIITKSGQLINEYFNESKK